MYWVRVGLGVLTSMSLNYWFVKWHRACIVSYYLCKGFISFLECYFLFFSATIACRSIKRVYKKAAFILLLALTGRFIHRQLFIFKKHNRQVLISPFIVFGEKMMAA